MKWQDGINRGKDFHIQNPVHIISLLSHRKRSHAKSDIATSIQPIPFSTPRIVRIFPIVPNSSLKSPSKKYPIMTRASRVKIYLLAAKRKGRKIHFLRRHFVVLFLGRGRKLLLCLRQNIETRTKERRLKGEEGRMSCRTSERAKTDPHFHASTFTTKTIVVMYALSSTSHWLDILCRHYSSYSDDRGISFIMHELSLTLRGGQGRGSYAVGRFLTFLSYAF